MERIGLAHLFEDQVEAAGSPLYWVFGTVCLVLLFGSFYVYLYAHRHYAQDRLHRGLAARFATLGGIFSFLGFASSAFSLLAVPFLSKRIWLLGALIGLLASAGYAAYYFKKDYPADRSAYEEHARRQRYLPRPKSGPRKRRRARR